MTINEIVNSILIRARDHFDMSDKELFLIEQNIRYEYQRIGEIPDMFEIDGFLDHYGKPVLVVKGGGIYASIDGDSNRWVCSFDLSDSSAIRSYGGSFRESYNDVMRMVFQERDRVVKLHKKLQELIDTTPSAI